MPKRRQEAFNMLFRNLLSQFLMLNVLKNRFFSNNNIFLEITQRLKKHVSTETSVIFSLSYKVMSWIYSVNKMLIGCKNKIKHDNVKYYKKVLN